MQIRMRRLSRARKLLIAGVLVLAVLIYWPQQRPAPEICRAEIAQMSTWQRGFDDQYWAPSVVYDATLASREGGRAIRTVEKIGPYVTVTAKDIYVEDTRLSFPPAGGSSPAIARVLDDGWAIFARKAAFFVGYSVPESAAFVLLIDRDARWCDVAALLDAVGGVRSRRAVFVFSRPFPELPVGHLSSLESRFAHEVIESEGSCARLREFDDPTLAWSLGRYLFPRCSKWRVAAEAAKLYCLAHYDPLSDVREFLESRENACGCAGGMDLVDTLLIRFTRPFQPKAALYVADQIALIASGDDARTIAFPAEARWSEIAPDFMNTIERENGRPIRAASR